MDVFPKWIIQGEDHYFTIGRFTYHKQMKLVDTNEEVLGGGWFHLDKENKILYLYGSSTDFGTCTLEQVRKAKEETDHILKDYIWKFMEGGDLGSCQMLGKIV